MGFLLPEEDVEKLTGLHGGRRAYELEGGRKARLPDLEIRHERVQLLVVGVQESGRPVNRLYRDLSRGAGVSLELLHLAG